MRCPKCGYNSFDHLDSCKKCGKDLTEHKQRFGIVSVLFPGQVTSFETTLPEGDESIVDEAVAAAATVAPDVVAEEPATREDVDVAEPSSEGDDFGFDFMGDSEEEEDLSFDELFEEAPADEDAEETLPSPKKEEAASGDDFSFDSERDSDGSGGDEELEDDFGFDPEAEIEKPAEDDFSFEPDTVNFDDEEQDSGAAEDPKDPFDLPESPQDEETPESASRSFSNLDLEAEVAEIEEDDLLAEEVRAEAATIEPSLEEESLEDEFFPPQQPLEELPDEDRVFDPFVDEQLQVAQENALEPSYGAPESEGEPLAVADAAAVVPAAAAVVSAAARAADEAGVQADFSTEDPEAFGEALESDEVDPLLPATGSRVAAFACDLLLLFLVGISFLIAAEAAISPAGGLLPTIESLIALSIPYFLVLFSLAFGYFTLFHFLAGQTPGKMLAGLRVESADGEPLLFSQAFLRSVGGLLQLLPAGLGYLAILVSAERRGWNDRLAGTRLISLKAVPEEG